MSSDDEKNIDSLIKSFQNITEKYPVDMIMNEKNIIDSINSVLKDESYIMEQKLNWLRKLKLRDPGPSGLRLSEKHIPIFYTLLTVIDSELTQDPNKNISLDYNIFDALEDKLDNNSAGLTNVSECMVKDVSSKMDELKNKVKDEYNKLNIKIDDNDDNVVSICNTMFCNELLKLIPASKIIEARTIIRRMCNNLKELEYKGFITDIVNVIEKVFEDKMNKLEKFNPEDSEYIKDALVFKEFKKQFADFLIQYNLIIIEHLEKKLKKTSGMKVK